MKTKMYEFRQNNSGGVLDVDENVCKWMFIEAENSEQANKIAQDLGVYFDGCENGQDCDCCGDRWSEADQYDITNLKEISDSYKEKFATITDYAQMLVNKYGYKNTEFARVFYLDGKRVQINRIEEG